MRRAFLISAVFGVASWGVAAAQMSSAAEMRAQMEAAGMTPAQIETALKAVADFTPPAAAVISTAPDAPICTDENQNKVCDEEEGDPQVTFCRKTYLNIIEREARDNYGTRLGESAMRIAQTCSTAAVGGTLIVRPGGSEVNNLDQLLEIGGYWNDVLSFARYLEPNETELDMDIDIDVENIDAIVATFPRDLRALMQRPDAGQDFYEISQPIHARCERIRRSVGQSFRADVHDNTVCLTTRPTPVAGDEGEAE